jgi:hypothetical protein
VRYLLLIYIAESPEPPDPALRESEQRAYNAFTEDIRARGIFQAGEALHPTSTATTVRIRDGEQITTDGPFAETKEALGGFYMVEARDLDEAIELAARIPAAKHGSIEVRPIWEYAEGEMSGEERASAAR